ncbi:Fic family protein [Pseudomonas poae]|uniref:Fic family protein n=1 Tax=Pseudomonas poae TaxID=200451 RepID=UPI0015E286DD|nr:Fic family protein [Pseudomonas poae]
MQFSKSKEAVQQGEQLLASRVFQQASFDKHILTTIFSYRVRFYLTHPLSEHFSVFNPLSGKEKCISGEVSIYKRCYGILDSAIQTRNVANVSRSLVATASELLGCSIQARDVPIYTRPDRFGNRVEYPEPGTLDKQLLLLAGYIVDSPVPSFARGIVATTAFLNLHPFCDGNGRVGRILLNYMWGRAPDNYVPVSVIHALSKGGYEIRLRSAQVFNEWDDLVAYYFFIVQILHLDARTRASD